MGNEQMSVLRFELPFFADPPLQTAEAVGLTNIVRRAAASYVMDVTLVDSEDARLLREGVVIAHRLTNGSGDWYFAAPVWAPSLPSEYVAPVSPKGKLPPEFSYWVEPILRRAMVGPFIALRCEREEWGLRDGGGDTVAHVRDERVTARRGGEVTTKYREVTLTPLAGLSELQRGFLIDAIKAAQGVAVEQFPLLPQRLGSPAAGLTNFPSASKLAKKATLEEFVAECFKKHLRALVDADVRRRTATTETDLGHLNSLLWSFLRDLRGLAVFLDPQWREATEKLLMGLPFAQASELEPALVAVLDALVGAVHAPRLGDESHKTARDVIFQRAELATMILADRCCELRADDPDEKWLGALKAAEHLDCLVAVGRPMLPKKVRKLAIVLEDMLSELVAARSRPQEPELDGMSPQQAFQLGRRTQRRDAEVIAWRQGFIESWPQRVRSARKAITKVKKK